MRDFILFSTPAFITSALFANLFLKKSIFLLNNYFLTSGFRKLLTLRVFKGLGSTCSSILSFLRIVLINSNVSLASFSLVFAPILSESFDRSPEQHLLPLSKACVLSALASRDDTPTIF